MYLEHESFFSSLSFILAIAVRFANRRCEIVRPSVAFNELKTEDSGGSLLRMTKKVYEPGNMWVMCRR